MGAAIDVVTGAFGFSGRAIAARLSDAGHQVRTLTAHPQRRPDDSDVEVRPLDFDDPVTLTESLRGATTLYNTYWVRFPHGRRGYDQAVANSRTLFHAARRAGVERIVHISITHPSIESPYAYFRGKAHVERALAESGVSYAIVRPAILFGDDGVLVNNIAWLLRHVPVFAVGGTGRYRVRPIHVVDLAKLCVEMAAGDDDVIVDAVGPERPTFRELVESIRKAVDGHALVVRVPGAVIPILSSVMGRLMRDVLLTGEEYWAMANGLADTDGPATGETRISEWIAAQGDVLGRAYANDLVRHFR